MSQNKEFKGMSSSLSSNNPLAIMNPIKVNNLVFSDLDFSFTGKGKRDKSVVLYQISDFSLISFVKRE
jgi:hypothetical protein